MALIDNDKDHLHFLAVAEKFIARDPKVNTPAAKFLDYITEKIEIYEKKRWPHLTAAQSRMNRKKPTRGRTKKIELK